MATPVSTLRAWSSRQENQRFVNGFDTRKGVMDRFIVSKALKHQGHFSSLKQSHASLRSDFHNEFGSIREQFTSGNTRSERLVTAEQFTFRKRESEVLEDLKVAERRELRESCEKAEPDAKLAKEAAEAKLQKERKQASGAD